MNKSVLSASVASIVTLLILFVALFVLDAENKPVQIKSQAEKQKGFSYATWWSGQYSHPDADLALKDLADTGANWISLIVTQYQDNISSTTIYSTTATPTDADLIHVISQAHNLGLRVMLKPHVDLANDPTHWRGQIGQEFTETAWTAWFASYKNFINHYAQLAQIYSVDQFCVGTELSATESGASHWQAVIAGVRNQYSGPITYAANHGDETSIIWWDAVDYIGVDAYYTLTSKNDPTVDELKTAWQPYLTTLAALASTWNKSIIFTEIGYRSQDGTNQHSWDWQLVGEIDLQEQADTYQAAFASVFNQPWFAGLYWWSWETDPFQGGPCDDGYTPYDKPAEDVLRSWYSALPREIPSLPNPDYSHTLDIYTDSLGFGWENWSWDATVDFSTTGPIYSGTQAISVTAQAWGALSLHHISFDSSPYYWLEFYLRPSADQLLVFANDESDTELRYRPVDDCRYTDKGVIVPEVWTRVRIPLGHLNAADRHLQSVSIKNSNDRLSSFWIDEIRLIGASWDVYLPIALQSATSEQAPGHLSGRTSQP